MKRYRIALGGACADTVSRSMRSTAVDVHHAEMQDVHTLFSGHYLRNRSTLDIGVLGYIGIVQYKEHSPEVWSIPPVTPSICLSKQHCIPLCPGRD